MHRIVGSVCALLVVAFLTGSALPAAAQAPRAEAKLAAGPVVNLNTATLAELETLPGIGPRTAGLIVEYRQKTGGFKKIEDLMNVKGIGEKSFLRLKPRLLVVPPKPEKTSPTT